MSFFKRHRPADNLFRADRVPSGGLHGYEEEMAVTAAYWEEQAGLADVSAGRRLIIRAVREAFQAPLNAQRELRPYDSHRAETIRVGRLGALALSRFFEGRISRDETAETGFAVEPSSLGRLLTMEGAQLLDATEAQEATMIIDNHSDRHGMPRTTVHLPRELLNQVLGENRLKGSAWYQGDGPDAGLWVHRSHLATPSTELEAIIETGIGQPIEPGGEPTLVPSIEFDTLSTVELHLAALATPRGQAPFN